MSIIAVVGVNVRIGAGQDILFKIIIELLCNFINTLICNSVAHFRGLHREHEDHVTRGHEALWLRFVRKVHFYLRAWPACRPAAAAAVVRRARDFGAILLLNMMSSLCGSHL